MEHEIPKDLNQHQIRQLMRKEQDFINDKCTLLEYQQLTHKIIIQHNSKHTGTNI